MTHRYEEGEIRKRMEKLTHSDDNRSHFLESLKVIEKYLVKISLNNISAKMSYLETR